MRAVKRFNMLAATMVTIVGLAVGGGGGAWGAAPTLVTPKNTPRGGIVDEYYFGSIEATLAIADGSKDEVRWNVTGSLPQGLSYHEEPTSVDRGNIIFQGWPNEAGEYSFTVVARNRGLEESAPATVNITITTPPPPPIIETYPLPNGTVGNNYNAGVGSYNHYKSWSLPKWNVSGLPPGLEHSEESGCSGMCWLDDDPDLYSHVSISGIPATAGTFDVTVVVVEHDGSRDEHVFPISITMPPPPVFTDISAPSSNGRVGAHYNSGAIARLAGGNYEFNPTGLPTGLVIGTYCGDCANIDGGYREVVITGQPTKSGTYNVSLTATNASGTSAPITFSITIDPPEPPKSPIIVSWDTPDGEVGVGYWGTIYVGYDDKPIHPNPPYYPTEVNVEKWSIVSGSLPPGLRLGLVLDNGPGPTSNFSIEGIPTAVGTYTFTVKVENETDSDTKQMSITIKALQKPVINPEAYISPKGEIGVDYNASIYADGSNITSFVVTGLPSGLRYEWYEYGNGYGYNSVNISGTPTQKGTFTVTATVRNGAGFDTKSFPLVVTDLLPPVITTTSLPEGVINQNYAVGIEADASNVTSWSYTGYLPPPLEFHESGSYDGYSYAAIKSYNYSGPPMPGYGPTEAGEFPITVTVTNAAGSDTKDFTVVIKSTPPKPVISNISMSNGHTGDDYYGSIEADGYDIEWSVIGSLPPGLIYGTYPEYLNDSSTFNLRGIPYIPGTYTFKVIAKNAGGSDTVEFTIKITATISVLTPNRVVPTVKPNEEATVIAPVTILAGEFTAGPNPVLKQSGIVKFYRQGKRVANCELRIYDATGNVINKVKIHDKVIGSQARRQVGSWNLCDRNSRIVSEGTYLVKGVVKTSDGKSEKVSVIVGVR